MSIVLSILLFEQFEKTSINVERGIGLDPIEFLYESFLDVILVEDVGTTSLQLCDEVGCKKDVHPTSRRKRTSRKLSYRIKSERPFWVTPESDMVRTTLAEWEWSDRV